MSPSRIVRWPAALTLALLALLVVCAVAFLSLRSSGTRVAAELVVISIVMLSVGAALSGGIWWQTGRRTEDQERRAGWETSLLDRLDAFEGRVMVRVDHLDARLGAIGLQILRVEECVEPLAPRVAVIGQRLDVVIRRVDTIDLMWEPTRTMPIVGRVAQSSVTNVETVDPKVVNIVQGMARRVTRES